MDLLFDKGLAVRPHNGITGTFRHLQCKHLVELLVTIEGHFIAGTGCITKCFGCTAVIARNKKCAGCKDQKRYSHNKTKILVEALLFKILLPGIDVLQQEKKRLFPLL